ncbi:unnamed protein product [Owenia fusiformis]|uniref:Uncharacterized protein n=1 Tax=Owenia fusiformis TaxID=6347 RepID=A0A8J1UHC6_OWEFU|nr:unnamed protein product [Owenia fusiformis]
MKHKLLLILLLGSTNVLVLVFILQLGKVDLGKVPIFIKTAPKRSAPKIIKYKKDVQSKKGDHWGPFNKIQPVISNITNNLEIPPNQLEYLETVYKHTCPEHSRRKLNHRHETQEDYRRYNNYSDVALLIVFNTAHYEVIPLLETMYRTSFPKILYCGPGELPQKIIQWLSISFISYGRSPRGRLDGAANYECLTMAFSLKLNVTGYIFLGDDVMFNFWNLRLPKNIPWSSPQLIGDLSEKKTKECTYDNSLEDWFCYATKWTWWPPFRFATLDALEHLQHVSKSSQVVHECLENLKCRNGAAHRVNRGLADIYYVPSKYAREYIELSTIFWKNKVWLEIAVPTILNCIAEERPPIIPGSYFKDYTELRNKPWVHFPVNVDKVFFHPAKLSAVIEKSQDHVTYFCDVVMTEIVKNT